MRNLVLWGHNLADYCEMFALTEDDLHGSILEYGSGPTSFNYEMQQRGQQVISCDVMFSQSVAAVTSYYEHAFAHMLAEVITHQDTFDWSHYGTVEQLAQQRAQGIQQFLTDYPAGQRQGSYVGCSVAQLPFNNFEFKLALSSHYLFANQEQHDINFHLAAIIELIRVAEEVRIFPLLNRLENVSELLGPVMLALQQQNVGVEIRAVPYSIPSKLSAGSNAMLRIWAQQCKL